MPDILPAADENVRIDPISGLPHLLMRGKIMGKLDVIIATKVSRTAHDPACWAPLTWSVRMRTQRKIPAVVTKIPPEKRRMSPAFFAGLRDALHSIGIGMLMRYRSVMTFKTTVTKISILEMAGWQWSNVRAPSQRGASCDVRQRETYCPDLDKSASSFLEGSSRRVLNPTQRSK